MKRVVEGRRTASRSVALDVAADWMESQRAHWERLFDVVDDT